MFVLVHGWNYRIWLANWAELSVIDEFDFTTRKIYQNFSNYSAWQRRAHLFPHYCAAMNSKPSELIRNEVEMCRTAAWTEPADQSVWFYQRWLFSSLSTALPNQKELLTELARDQLKSMLELLEVEPTAALVNSFVIFLLKLLNPEDPQILELLKKQAEIDPLRRNYYQQGCAQ